MADTASVEGTLILVPAASARFRKKIKISDRTTQVTEDDWAIGSFQYIRENKEWRCILRLNSVVYRNTMLIAAGCDAWADAKNLPSMLLLKNGDVIKYRKTGPRDAVPEVRTFTVKV